VDDLWATKREDVGLIVRAISYQRHERTDRQTDDMRSQDRALHYSASHGKNHISEHHQIFRVPVCCLWPWLGHPSTTTQYVMYFHFTYETLC